MNKTIKVEVFAYKGQYLIINMIGDLKEIEDLWYPITDGRFGSVLSFTAENLSCSKEALNLMKKIEVGGDAIGDIDWFKVDKGGTAFAWFGPISRIIDVNTAVAARGFKPYPEECSIIKNHLNNEIVNKVQKAISNKTVCWDEDRAFWNKNLL